MLFMLSLTCSLAVYMSSCSLLLLEIGRARLLLVHSDSEKNNLDSIRARKSIWSLRLIQLFINCQCNRQQTR